RDVAVSFYFFQKRHKSKDALNSNFTEYVTEKIPQRMKAWRNYVFTQMEIAKSTDKALVVQYEDMLADVKDQLRKMAIFANLPCEEERLDYAINRSKSDSMRES